MSNVTVRSQLWWWLTVKKHIKMVLSLFSKFVLRTKKRGLRSLLGQCMFFWRKMTIAQCKIPQINFESFIPISPRDNNGKRVLIMADRLKHLKNVSRSE